MRILPTLQALGLLLLFTAPSLADEFFVHVELSALEITEGKLPGASDDSTADWRQRSLRQSMVPRIVLDGAGEAYVNFDPVGFRPWGTVSGLLEQASVCVSLPAAGEATGRLYFPEADWRGMTSVRFRIAPEQASTDSHDAFHKAKIAHLQDRLNRRLPGAAWFRHQLRLSHKALDSDTTADGNQSRLADWRDDDLEDTYALFSGGRAMSENLQLDRVLLPADAEAGTVTLDTISGITTAEIDWTEFNADKQPVLDTLAAWVPFDQHAVFFKSFEAASVLAEESRTNGAPVLQVAEPRSEHGQTIARYEQQLGIRLNGWSKLLGPKVIRTLALTGSDPYFRTGTDVAVLFEAQDPTALRTLLAVQIQMAVASKPGVQPTSGELAGLPFSAFLSPDRTVSSYLMRLGEVVIVSNSLAQLQRLVQVHQNELAPLASLDGYRFFRDRYKLSDSDESAFLFLSDATIRRWCGPRWRIAMSRRTRDMAVINELQAAHMPSLVDGRAPSSPITTYLPLAGETILDYTPSGVHSKTFGTLAFMTPILEVPIERVSKAEAEAYSRWKRGYERNWQWAFDPIGLRLFVDEHNLSADVTIMPLIAGSDYRDLIEFTGSSRIEPLAAQPHDTLAHAIIAIDRQSEPVRMVSGFASSMGPGLRADPFSWLGQYISLHADNDPIWAEIAELPREEWNDSIESYLGRLPVVLEVDVHSVFKLTAFLVSLRAFVEQTAPGLTLWENGEHKGQAYVKISPSQSARDMSPEFQDLSLCYAATPQALIVSFNEQALHAALERRSQPAPAEKPNADATPAANWVGEHLGFRFERPFIDLFSYLIGTQYHSHLQSLAWGNLPILNTWKRLYPDRDPIQVHQQIWHTRLICPGGGQYIWNEDWQTMESTLYGHPGSPKQGPSNPSALQTLKDVNLGLTFEEQGLRARAVLKR